MIWYNNQKFGGLVKFKSQMDQLWALVLGPWREEIKQMITLHVLIVEDWVEPQCLSALDFIKEN